jgi:DNA/RNA endonuclease G (NUC1)
VDLELPKYARIGTSYDGNDTLMDRGHMARHEDNRAWGIDSSKMGCLMSNSTPQHRSVNRGAAWRNLEDMVQAVVKDADSEIEVIWTISDESASTYLG